MISKVVDTRLLRHVWIISWPTVVYSLMEAAVGLVDIYFAGLLGDEAMASIGLCRQLFLILMIGTIAITTGTLALVSQHYGAKRYDWASSITFHSIFLAVLAGVIFGLIGYVFADEGLIILGAKGKVLQYGTEYLRMLMTGVVFLLVNFAGNGVFRALGDAKTPLKIALFINILNVILSYMLVFGIGWLPAFGVMGIAMGTVFARGIGAVIALWIMRHPHRTVRLNIRTPIQKSHFQQILRIGLPSGISGFFRNGARILFFWIIANSMAGTTALAAAAVCFQIRMITIMPSLAFQVGVAALVGQSIGKNDYKKAEAYGWTSTKLCSFIMAVVSIILFIFPPFFIRFFTDTPEVIQLGTSCMRFMVMEQFANCVSIVVSGALAGAGDTKPSLRYTILSQWFLMAPLAYCLVRFTPMDIHGAWLAWGLAPLVQMLLTLSRFYRGKWKHINATGFFAPQEES